MQQFSHSSIRRQHGLTMISWMFVIAIGIFFILIGFKMIPVYMENYSLRHSMMGMQDDKRLRDEGPSGIKKSLQKRLRINGVYDLPMEAITVTKEDGHLRLDVKYEIRKPVAGNVAIVMSFAESVEIRGR